MPLYEFHCKFDGRFELLLKEAPKGKRACPKCGARSPLIFPLTVMRPDPYWSGIMTEHYGYVTSSSKLAQIRKERHLVEVGDRADREAMKKTADEAAKARDEKFSKDTRKFLEDRFAGAGVLDSFGQLRPEATRKLSEMSLMDPKGEEQEAKKESITITQSNDLDV